MTADTAKIASKKVTGRRKLRFASLDEVIADAQRLTASPQTRTLGNWPLGQLLAHLAGAINASIDGIHFQAPWMLRLFGAVMKPRFLNRGVPAGFKLPKEVEPRAFPPASAEEGLDKLRQAVARQKTARMTARHPVFGQLTHEEWTRAHLRHSELHLSFAQPE